jgi:Glycine-zipper domain
MCRAASLLVPGITLVLSACVVAPPAGPSVMALPGQGKNFEGFQQDDGACRQYAWQQTGGAAPGAAASQSEVGSAVAGTALGAAAGAAIGAASGAAGAGAAIGAGAGLLAGSAIGANNAAATYGGVQQLYDVSYTQCMVAHGNSVQAPPTGYASYPYPSYPYPYPYSYPGYYGPALFAPSIAFGFGGGFGGGRGWGGHGHWRN